MAGMGDAGASATELNEELVRELERTGVLRDPAVAAAFRAVRRHHFLPDRPLDEVYADAAILTKYGEHGLPISSSSQPAIMAIMLELLRVRPGDHVLEVGAGTGYNAALLARLTGPAGRVVTLDVDRELCVQARANLARAGGANVLVVLADGAGGWPDGAPYDRVILTVGAEDLSVAWLDQLRDGGRLVVPLGLGGTVQLCVAFDRRGGLFVSDALTSCGFMPLRGEMAPSGRGAIDEPGLPAAESGRPSGHTIADADLRAGFETWLMLMEEGFVRTRLRPQDPALLGVREGSGLALLTGDGQEHEVTVFGDRGGDAAAARLIEAHRAWVRERPRLDQVRIVAYPTGAGVTVPGHVRVLRRLRFTFVVQRPG